MNNKKKVIEAMHLEVYRGGNPVFQDLSLEINQGENTVILGPNGAGKTTLLQLLSREIYPVASPNSSLKLFGEESWELWKLRSRLGIVSQEVQEEYSGFVTCLDVVLSGLFSSVGIKQNHRVTPAMVQRAGALLSELGIPKLKNQLFANISTGEKRRCLLGRAMIHNPEILLLDEPTSGLDLKAAFELLRSLQKFIDKGGGLILVTHRIYEILPRMQWIIMLKNGKVFASGPKQEILTSERLSALFETPLRLLSGNGFYQVVPV